MIHCSRLTYPQRIGATLCHHRIVANDRTCHIVSGALPTPEHTRPVPQRLAAISTGRTHDLRNPIKRGDRSTRLDRGTTRRRCPAAEYDETRYIGKPRGFRQTKRRLPDSLHDRRHEAEWPVVVIHNQIH